MRRIAGLSIAPLGATRRVAVFATAMLLAFTSIGAGAASPGPVQASVVNGWHHNPATNHDYAQLAGLTWSDAETRAVALGGHLVTINDADEQAWLSATFTQANLAIGLNDRAQEGTWVWASGEPVTYTHWTPGEPNDANPPLGEDIGVMNWTDPWANVGWNDLPDNGPVSSIIETPAGAHIPTFRFTVDPGGHFIDGQFFTPGDAIDIALNDRPIGSRIADPEGHFWLDTDETIVPGDTVTVNVGSESKSHVVSHVHVTGAVGNLVSGVADGADGTNIDFWVWEANVYRSVPVVGHLWSVDVSVAGDPPDQSTTTALKAGDGIGVEELDVDGDGTQFDWQVPNPRFSVLPDGDAIAANEFTPGATLQVTHNGTVLDANGATFDENGNTWFDAQVDLKPGDTIIVGDGNPLNDKTHVVTDLAIKPIVGNVVSGTASGGSVRVSVWDTDVWRDVAVVGGLWSVDVNDPGTPPQPTTTLGTGSRVGAEQFDVDGDGTQVGTHVFDPHFTVGVNGPWIQGFDFAPNGTVTIKKNTEPIATDDPITTDRDGQFWLDSPVEFAAGDTIEVSDTHVTKTMTIAPLSVDHPIVGNVVKGHATPNADVHLWVDDTDVNRGQSADGLGDWSIDVSVKGNEDWEQQTTELGLGSSGGVEEYDGNGNGTHVDWGIPNPTINADPNNDSIHGDQFGQPVTVTIHPVTGEDRTWSGDAISYEEDWFDVGLADDPEHPWDLKAGDTVTVEGPNGTKILVVADLQYSGYDLGANTVSGSTDRAGTVTVDIEKGDEQAPHAEVGLTSGGDWVVDFDDADPPYDLKRFDGAWISQSDEDGDSTTIGLKTLAPTRFMFSPVIQDVVGSAWPKGADVTLTIHRDGVSPDFTATTSVGMDCNDRDTCPSEYMPLTGDANVFFNLSIGPFQARAGDVMTMSNGTITKGLIVPDITVGLGEDDVTWTGDDADQVWVPAPHPDLGMDPQADRVWVSDLPTAGNVMVSIKRGQDLVYAGSVDTRTVFTRGEWLLDMWTQPTGNEPRPAVALFDLGGFDLQGGDVVTVTGAMIEPMTQTVATLSVDTINAATDTVTGTANPNPDGTPPDEQCSVSLHLGEGEGGWWGYCAIPDADGHWSFHFDSSHFPWQGLEPGMVGQAIINHSTIVFWTVRDGHGGNVTVTADDLTIDFGAALPTLTWQASGLDSGDTWTTEPACTTTAVVGSPVGTYPITCTGAAADGYTVAYEDGTLTVVPALQTIDFTTITDQTMGGPPLALHATASSGLPVTFMTTTPTVCTIGGRKLDKLTLAGPGECVVTADQAGDGNWLAAPQVPQTFTVSLKVSTVAVTSDRATSVFGQVVRITASVTGADRKPTGMATFMDGTDVLATMPLKNGKATLTSRALAVGTHDISVEYGGSATYAGATGTLAGGLTVTQAVSKATITNAADLARKATKVGVVYVVKVHVVAVAPGSGLPTGTVQLTDGTFTCTATLAADGTASCSFTPTTAGVVTLTATYGGDPAFTGSTVTATHTVATR